MGQKGALFMPQEGRVGGETSVKSNPFEPFPHPKLVLIELKACVLLSLSRELSSES